MYVMGRYQPLRNYNEWKRRKIIETRRLNEIILTEEMNQLHRNGILIMFNEHCHIPHVLSRLAVRNGLHWRCTGTSKLAVTVVGANLCVRGPLQVKGKGIRRMGGVTGKETCTVHTFNIISERQYFVTRCLSSFVGDVFGLRSICVCFPSTRKLVTQTKLTVWSRVQCK
jgi:hypothetical protein